MSDDWIVWNYRAAEWAVNAAAPLPGTWLVGCKTMFIRRAGQKGWNVVAYSPPPFPPASQGNALSRTKKLVGPLTLAGAKAALKVMHSAEGRL